MCDQSMCEQARNKALLKGYFVKDDFYHIYQALLEDLAQFEKDMAYIAELRPDVLMNTDCSFDRAYVEANKPEGYDEWATNNTI